MVENSVYGIRGFNSHCKQRKRAIASCCDCVAATYLHQSGPLVVFDVAEVSSARELDVFGKPLQNTTNTGTPRERVSAQKSLCLNIVIEVVYIVVENLATDVWFLSCVKHALWCTESPVS